MNKSPFPQIAGGFTSSNWIHACKWSIQWLKPSLECVWDASLAAFQFFSSLRVVGGVSLSFARGFSEHITHSMHVWYGISTYMYHTNQPNVGRYTVRPMDGMGKKWHSTHFPPFLMSLYLLLSHCNVYCVERNLCCRWVLHKVHDLLKFTLLTSPSSLDIIVHREKTQTLRLMNCHIK